MIKIPEKTEYVIDTLLKNGYEAYIVGGCVRDMLMGKTPNDYDVTTSAVPQEVMNLFEKTVPTGIKHGTVTVIVDKTPIETTTFRTESEYKDARHPDNVSFVTSLKEDLSRRDFTVNAIAYNNTTGIIDFFGGTKDIENKILKAVGNPEKRFNEDALRILRLFRFSSVLNFACEENTLNAAIKTAPLLKKISSERIFTELYKAVAGENFKIFESIISCGGLNFLKITKSPNYEIIKNCNSQMLAFFAFLYFSSTNIKETLNILKVSNNLKNYCEKLLILMDENIPETKAEIKTLLCDFQEELIKDFLQLKNLLTNEDIYAANSLLEDIIKSKEPYFISDLQIDGSALKNMGITGIEIGKTLKHLQKIVIENPKKNTTESLIEEIKNLNRN